jgi:hypothetical protein
LPFGVECGLKSIAGHAVVTVGLVDLLLRGVDALFAGIQSGARVRLRPASWHGRHDDGGSLLCRTGLPADQAGITTGRHAARCTASAATCPQPADGMQRLAKTQSQSPAQKGTPHRIHQPRPISSDATARWPAPGPTDRRAKSECARPPLAGGKGRHSRVPGHAAGGGRLRRRDGALYRPGTSRHRPNPLQGYASERPGGAHTRGHLAPPAGWRLRRTLETNLTQEPGTSG